MSVSGGELRDTRWWLIEPTGDVFDLAPSPHVQVKAEVLRIKERQSARSLRALLHMCLYGSDPVLGFGIRTYATLEPRAGDPLGINIVKSVISTLVSRVVKSKPKPTYLTSGGDFYLQQEAKKLDKWTEGQFYANNTYKMNRAIVRDALIFGTGGVHGFEWHGKPKLERVFTPEVLVDDAEAKYGDPRTLRHIRTIDRRVLMEIYDDRFHDKIRDAAPSSDDDWQSFDTNSGHDQVDVYEAWHLPSGPGAGDGRHVVCLENCTLEYDTFKDDKYPERFLRYEEPVLGWYGTGLAQLLTGKQLEINKLLMEIQRSFHLGSNFRVLVQRGSKIIKSHFNNEIGGILEYTGAAPVFAVAQTVHPEKFQHLIWLIQQSFAEAGINQMTAAGQKDPTLKSAKAQEVAMDVEDSRYADFVQAYEEFCLEEADLLYDIGRVIGKVQVMYTGRKTVETIDLGEINLEKNEFAVKCLPTSALASAPGQRMQQVQDLANAGWITPADAKRLLDFPDLELAAELDTAPYDIVMQMLDAMLEEGKYTAPLPQMDLQMTLGLTVNYYLRAKVKFKDVEPDNLALILKFMAEVSFYIKQSQQPDSQDAQPEAAPQGATPAAGQMPPGAPPPPGQAPGMAA